MLDKEQMDERVRAIRIADAMRVAKKLGKSFSGYEVTTEDDRVVIIVPEGVTKIERFTFHKKLGFHKVILPQSLVEIEQCAFLNCTDLEEIEIPSGVKKLECETFIGCTSLKKVVLNEGLEKISCGVFADTPALEELNIPASVIALGEDFYDDVYDTTYYCSPFKATYAEGSGIARANIVVACPDRFGDKCFNGTKED